ncbi:hypothetical protein NU219Hw_g3548t1 [Hortaea werneckii]
MAQDQDLEEDARAQSSRSSGGDGDSNTSIVRQRWQRAIRRVIRLTKLKSISEPLSPPFGDPLTRNPAITWHPWRPYNPDAATPQSLAPFRCVPGQSFQPQTYEVLGRRWDGNIIALDHFQKAATKSQAETSAADSRTSEEEITREAAVAETVAETMRRQSFEGGVKMTSGRRNFGNPRPGVGVWSFNLPPIESQKFGCGHDYTGPVPLRGAAHEPVDE